jgi:hypothetical protein
MNYALTGKNSQKLRRQGSGDGGQNSDCGFGNSDFRMRISDCGLGKSAGQLVESSNGQMVQMVNCQVPDYLTNFLFD